MENVVSARRLRKSMVNNIGDIDVNLCDFPSRNRSRQRHIEQLEQTGQKEKRIAFKTKLLIKVCICCVILFSVVIGKTFFLEKLKENSMISRVYSHYITDFSRAVILDKTEFQIKKLNTLTGDIVPDKIKEYSKTKYFNSVKPFVLTFDLKESVKKMLNINTKVIADTTILNENESTATASANTDETLNGIGGAQPAGSINTEKIIELSQKEKIAADIRAKGISIIRPVGGVITSNYGDRDEIFPGVDPYHTGIDIANVKGTMIPSATKGKVSKVVFNDKYYGNFVEVTEQDVIFKYAHLESISVNEGDIVNQSDKLGIMGSTGMSTGTHLHFEIKYLNKTIDPKLILDF